MSTRKRVWELFETAEGGDRVSKTVDIFIVALIILSTTMVIIDSVPGLLAPYRRFTLLFDSAVIAVFTIEYLLRLWSCTSDPRYSGPVKGRLRYATTPLALVDLVAIAPFYMPWFLPRGLLFLRVLRLVRVLRLFKVGRYSDAPGLVMRAFARRRAELLAALFVLFLLLVSMASLLYLAENPGRPELYTSIPESMWWSILALTGNGQVAPITLVGRLVASVIAIIGVGLFALPAGLLASAFTEELGAGSDDIRVGDHDIERVTRRVVLANAAKRTNAADFDLLGDDYDGDAVILLGDRVLTGPSGAVEAITAVLNRAPADQWRLSRYQVAGATALMHWESGSTDRSEHAVETIVVRDGLIRLHTIDRCRVDPE